MRKALSILVVLLVPALVVMPKPAQSEMYVEAYLGGVGANGLSNEISLTTPVRPNVVARGTLPGATNGAFLAGLKIGTWFVPTGFLGYKYPDWMKYFGFYVDFSYHNLEVRKGQFTFSQYESGVFDGTRKAEFKSNGKVATWAFMFAARYGFLPDSEVPLGRLQPYVAVGPAVLLTSQSPALTVYQGRGGVDFSDSLGTSTSTDIALAVDAGVRYMCLKNVSLDLSFKYRYAQPGFSYTIHRAAISMPLDYNPPYHLFSGQLGVAYHF